MSAAPRKSTSRGAGGTAGNPWSKEGWNPAEQSRLVIVLGTKAAEIAAAAGSYIGATEPGESNGD